MASHYMGREGAVDLYYHDDGENIIIEERGDAQPVIDKTSYLSKVQTAAPIRAGSSRLNDYERQGIAEGWLHVGTVDAITQTEWMREGIYLWKWGKCDWTTRKIKQKLNSSEWRKLRTGHARI